MKHTKRPDEAGECLVNEEMKSKRDEMAKAYGLDIFPVQPVSSMQYLIQGVIFSQDTNFAKRMTHIESYQKGFDAGFDLAMEEAKVLIECLDRITRLTAHTENPTKEMAEYLTKQAGMKSRELAIEALKEFKARSE